MCRYPARPWLLRLHAFRRHICDANRTALNAASAAADIYLGKFYVRLTEKCVGFRTEGKDCEVLSELS